MVYTFQQFHTRTGKVNQPFFSPQKLTSKLHLQIQLPSIAIL